MDHIHIILPPGTASTSPNTHWIKLLLAIDPKQNVGILVRADQHAIEIELARDVVQGFEAEVDGHFAELVAEASEVLCRGEELVGLRDGQVGWIGESLRRPNNEEGYSGNRQDNIVV